MRKIHVLVLLLLMALPLGARAELLKGDVNSDGIVGPDDVATLISYLLYDDDSGINLMNADLDQDSRINIGDATQLISLVKSIQEDPMPDPQTRVFSVNGVEFTMVFVEGGTFTMGATPEQGDDVWDNEMPAHEVTLRAYGIGQTEVTQELWLAVMGDNPSYYSSALGYDENLLRPVEWVSWDDCQAFIAHLNQLTGQTFRLPTEAEWEFAARGGNRSQGYKYAGSDSIGEVAWYWIGQAFAEACIGTKTVATKLPNELGLYDMSGNVWEWCQDDYCSYDTQSQITPTDPSGENTFKVYRGGDWGHEARYCRVSARNYGIPDYTIFSLGLRLAM